MTNGRDQLVLIGVIMGTHGLGGELRVRPENGDPRRFRGVDRVSSGVAMALVFRNAEWCQNVGMGRAR